jgi:hypothetical protein
VKVTNCYGMKPAEQLQQLVETLERVTATAENLRIESPKRFRDKDTGQLIPTALSHERRSPTGGFRLR